MWWLLWCVTITLMCLCKKEPLPTSSQCREVWRERRKQGHLYYQLSKDCARSTMSPEELEVPCPRTEDTSSERTSRHFNLGRWYWHELESISTGGLILMPFFKLFDNKKEKTERKANQKSCWHLQSIESSYIVFLPHWKNCSRCFMELHHVGSLCPKHSHWLPFLENCLEISSVLGHWEHIFRVFIAALNQN